MVTDSNKPRASTAPPHELNVRKFAESRASELGSLHSIVSSRLDNDFRSQRNKRKRTTGHDDRVAKKKRFSKGRRGKNGSSVVKDDKKIPRRVRRSIEFKKNLPNAFGTSGDGTKRLRTHVWYAKRFTMTKLWGFHIPLGLHGGGRGSRAMLKKLKNGVLVHDASYHSAIQLEGPQEKLLLILNSVLVPSPATLGEAVSCGILTGGVAGSAMLHQDGNPSFPPIAPVTYMWRPSHKINSDEEVNNVANEQKHVDDRTTSRQLWVWIHAAAFTESYGTLKSACERQMDLAGDSVQCISLAGQLGKLELVGSKVSDLLQKTLFPVHCSWLLKEDTHNDHAEPESKDIPKSHNQIFPWHLKKYSANAHDDHREAESTNILKNGDQISSSLVNLTVIDPRTLNKKESIAVSERNHLGVISSDQMETKETNMLSSIKQGSECRINCSDLWEASQGLCPPVEEIVVCMEKHHQRKDFIRLGSKALGTQNLSVGKCSRSCPILLLEYGRHEESVARCSIILPLSWIKVFWLSFISNGAHAIGLREKQWISSDIGLPYFPQDFPDCKAYTNMMAIEKVVSDQKRNLLPSSKRPMEVPISPPWNGILRNFEKQSNEAMNSHNQVNQPVSEDYTLDKLENSGSFEGIIARTSLSVNGFMNKFSRESLLVFPRVQNQKNCMYTFMKDKDFPKQDTIMPEVEHKGCFLRVFLHAYKEGVFEGGAVVCAPRIDDIMLWTRSENVDEKLNISESGMRSYFVKSVCGKWEVEVPKEEEFYRWPIGFVTTGVVRGSKKGNATAICEATLLSKLRMEQWKVFNVRQRRKEIYVLVRNLRSTAYRLALATLVLEQVEEDVKFM